MSVSDKPKNKRRPYPLRWVLLTMVIGLILFMWMPVVIVSPTGIHPLTRVLYWLGIFAWLLPLARWFYRQRHISYARRLVTPILLFVLWIFLFCSLFLLTKRSGMLFDFWGSTTSCEVIQSNQNERSIYLCYTPREIIPTEILECPRDCGFYAVFGLGSRIVAEKVSALPLAQITEAQWDFFTISKLKKLHEADDAIRANCC